MQARRFMVLLLGLVACSSPAGSGQPPSGLTDVGGGTDVIGGFSNDMKQVGKTDGIASDTSSTAAEVIGSSCEFAKEPAPGQAGAACTKASDCESSFCVETATGGVCTRSCSECCPTGFKCEQSPANDAVFICLPKLTALCRPCKTDSECGAISKDAVCVGYGDNGRFCGGACAADSDCADGYACKTVTGQAGGTSQQCVLKSGECACSPKAIAAGASTTCQLGACSGIRTCTPDGLSKCDAVVAGTETCNGKDDNCDGQTDEENASGCKQFYPDGDGDGVGKSGVPGKCLCAAVDLYTAASTGDCDDENKSVQFNVAEKCNNLDDDCDGQTDEGCDADKDGWCNAAMPLEGKPTACPKGGNDCDDADAKVNPSQGEVCGNGKDDDCSGKADTGIDAAGCTPFFLDYDQDGYGSGTAQCQCAGEGQYTASKSGDCDDKDAQMNPGMKELCINGKDDNCSGAQDEIDAVGCTPFWADKDADGFGIGASACLCKASIAYPAKKDGDCNDTDGNVSPAKPELCNNAKDDNCNGLQDEPNSGGCQAFYADGDKDGWGNISVTACLCGPNEQYPSAKGGDCNDAMAAVYPNGQEKCDGLDNNCNGQIDESGAVGCSVGYEDKDGDGFGTVTKQVCACVVPGGYAMASGDCDDSKPAVNPGAVEKCNGFDDNCDQVVDPVNANGCTNFYSDGDSDGFGTGAPKCQCGPSAPFTATANGDCNDAQKTIFPGATEVTCDSVDQNCDGADTCNGCAHDKCATGTKLVSTCDPCVTSVCALDPYCCAVSWDSSCVAETKAVCGSGGCAATGACAHSLCATGSALASGCDKRVDCVSKVCANDPFCCTTGWDSACVSGMKTYCNLVCQ